MSADAVAVAVFAKAPVAGYAKTRLIPRLGPEGAAALQGQLVARAVATALATGLGPVSLWCAPDRAHPLFADLAARRGLTLWDQCEGDLGARLLDAFERLTPEGPLLLIGTDCPALTAAHLKDCAASLARGHDAVFLPAEDGGYALVGLRRPIPDLFADMPWGGGRVMTETRTRAEELGLRIAEPASVWDLDRPQDYDRAVASGLLDPA